MAAHLEFNLPDHEKLVSCPYNKAHQVVQHRLPNHLIKCRRSHSSLGLKECRFNVSHVFKEDEIKNHEKNCPDRLLVELAITTSHAQQEKLRVDSGFFSVTNVPSVSSVKHSHWDPSDDWDIDESQPSYDPKQRNKGLDIMKNIKHGTPSERRAIREKEAVRLHKIREHAIENPPVVQAARGEAGPSNA